MANFITGIISLSIGAVVLASVFITQVKGIFNSSKCLGGWNGTACTSGATMTTSEVALWGLITLVGIAGMIYGVMNVFGMA